MNALGWALFHFLWQGVAVSAALAITLRLLRSHSPQARYLAASASLAFMTASVPLTGLVLASRGTGSALEGGLPPGLLETLDAAPASPYALGTLLAWCESNMALVVAFWALGASFLLLRAGGGWYLARRQIRLGLPLDYPLSILMERLEMSGTVEIYRSATAVTPHVFGWLKPVIVVPVAALAQLPPAQLEALLAHELAHIRRRDYLVNLLQIVVESLLFYHPAVWWVSSVIRRERELCCDDLAVDICGDRIEYSQALLKLEEVTPAMSIAASGSGLKQRIARLLSTNEADGWAWSAPLAPVLALTAVVVLLSGVWWVQGAPPAPPGPSSPVVAPAPSEPPAPAAAPVVAHFVGQAPPAPPAPPPEPRPKPEPAPAPPDPEEVRQAIEKSKQELEKALAELQSNKFKVQEDMRRALEETKQLREQMNTDEAKLAIERALRDLERHQGQFARQMQQAERQIERSAARSQVSMERAQKAEQRAEARRKERERRIEFADKKWGAGSVKGSKTSRGRHYVQYGPPDEIETLQGGSENWRYRNWQKTGGTISFEFDKEGNKR